MEKSIVVKFQINDDLITNYDIIKETNYLIALNKDLVNIDKNQLAEFAKNSLLKEKIKKYELEKYYNINYETDAVDIFLESFVEQLNLKDLEDLNSYLLNYQTNLQEVRKKLVIEQTWNKMILDMYIDRVVIDEKNIKETLEILINEKKKQ